MSTSTVTTNVDAGASLLRGSIDGGFYTLGESRASADLIGDAGRKNQGRRAYAPPTSAQPDVIATMLRAINQESPIVRLVPKSACALAELQHRTLGAVR